MATWFTENNMNLQKHLAVSPSLNPTENLWGILASNIYVNDQQFETVKQLKDQIKDSWAKIEKH